MNELLFSPDPAVRKLAVDLYESIKDLPLLSPHGHTEAQWFAENKAFSNPTDLIITPDHYILRMLVSRGISLDELGVPRSDGTRAKTDPKEVWKLFARNFHLFSGTPSGIWIREELKNIFHIDLILNEVNADAIYDQLDSKLKSEEFLPRSMYEKFNLELLSTTNGASDDLKWHKMIATSEWNGRVIPCFRPDDVTDIGNANWHKNIFALNMISKEDTSSYQGFVKALRKRRDDFIELGCNSTDHGVESPWTFTLSDQEAERIYKRAIKGKATEMDRAVFTAHMLMVMAEMSCEDGLVMQIHPGVYRNYDQNLFEVFGADKGADIPIKTEYTHNLSELLNAYGSHKNFKLIVYTLDETTYTRELAPLAGYFPAMHLGPSWWFNDSFQGMKRFKESIVETAGFYNLTGFVDDTRALPSIPIRHEIARRADADYLAEITLRGIITKDEAYIIMKELAYGLTKRLFKI
jgi:glucuronate isomerase